MRRLEKLFLAHQDTGRDSVANQTQPEKTLTVQIVIGPGDRDEVTRLLDSRGISHSPVEGNQDIDATVPVSMLSTLAAHPEVMELIGWLPYGKLGEKLNVIVAQYETGLMSEKEADSNFALLVISIAEDEDYDANYDKVKYFLEDNGAVIANADIDIYEGWKKTV